LAPLTHLHKNWGVRCSTTPRREDRGYEVGRYAGAEPHGEDAVANRNEGIGLAKNSPPRTKVAGPRRVSRIVLVERKRTRKRLSGSTHGGDEG